ncbi:hypothetical protein BX661DRAFT_175081 [Kickxella alabastrina]|uniref:uncharacterized protein n=1 Tax=Kickxella alabastrina TaxID=61397 RepID=UPI00221F397C|nr:uncharacterized protein BX661DRAFT_175081 [Kickxella alabastrina]KAI7834562.1 hypothetical protein BX661DRAFT_175081 [Kickxella alabastrina]
MVADITGLSFGILIVLGGVIGFLKSNSIASLISGLVFGALIAVSTQFAATHSNRYNLLPAAVCLALFSSWEAFMPGGMVTFSSLFMAIRYIIKYF